MVHATVCQAWQIHKHLRVRETAPGYGRLLAEFWTSHDPTQLNRQGPDIGAQYRSIILTHDDEQCALAEASKAKLQEASRRPITTEIQDAGTFYPAEEYHQQYYEKRGISSCAVTVMNAVGR